MATFADVATRKCLQCAQQCRQCVGMSFNCTSCSDGYLLIPALSQCVLQCPPQTYPDLAVCQPCPLHCLECSSTSHCYACASATYLSYADGDSSQCVEECGSGYFGNAVTGECTACIYPCLTCATADRCLSCALGLFLSAKTGHCVTSCQYGTYLLQSPASPA